MPSLPSHNDLVAEFRNEVIADPETNLTDFRDGSVNRGFAGIAATAALGIYRWIARQVSASFVQSAKDADLDYAIADVVGDALPRLPGEANDAYRARFFAYIGSLSRGTASAWRYFLDQALGTIEPLGSSASDGAKNDDVVLSLEGRPGVSALVIEAEVMASLSEWRLLGVPLRLEIVEVPAP